MRSTAPRALVCASKALSMVGIILESVMPATSEESLDALGISEGW